MSNIHKGPISLSKKSLITAWQNPSELAGYLFFSLLNNVTEKFIYFPTIPKRPEFNKPAFKKHSYHLSCYVVKAGSALKAHIYDSDAFHLC